MEYLGFNRSIGAVYEGTPYKGYRVLPPPVLAPIRFFIGEDIPKINFYHEGLASEIFREDDFDPVTKLRRGRVFKLQSVMQPHNWKFYDPHQQDLPPVKWGYGVVQQADLSTYERDHLPDLAKVPSHKLPTVIIGWDPHITFWKIVSIECNLVGTPVLSLRARHSLGDTPEIIESNVPADLLKPLAEALEKVESSVNRLAPIEVIDRCRDMLSIVFGFKAGDMSRDLVSAINGYLKNISKDKENKDDLCSWCGRIVARLHSRGKPNEQADKNLPHPQIAMPIWP